MSDFLTSLGDAGFDLSSIVSGGGLVTMVVLFATDRILTKGQHERRVADLVAHHESELKDKDDRYDEMREARDLNAASRDLERERADKVFDQLVDSVEVAKAAVHALTSLDEAARGSQA